MRRNIINWAVIIVAAFSFACFTACGSDDDENVNVKEKLLGMWHRVGRTYVGEHEFKDIYFNHINFLADGTCQCYRSNPDGYARICTWSYSESSKILRIYGTDGTYDFAYNMRFEFLDNGDWVGSEDNYTWIYSRNLQEDDDEIASVQK